MKHVIVQDSSKTSPVYVNVVELSDVDCTEMIELLCEHFLQYAQFLEHTVSVFKLTCLRQNLVV